MLTNNTDLYDEGVCAARTTYAETEANGHNALFWASRWLENPVMQHLPYYEGFTEGLRQSILEAEAARVEYKNLHIEEQASQHHSDSVALDRITAALLDQPGSTGFWATLRDALVATGRLSSEVAP